MFVFTSLIGQFFDICQQSKAQSDTDGLATALASLFADPAQEKRNFEQGCFVYAPAGGGGPFREPEDYGWAAVSRSHMEQAWGMDGIEAIDDPSRFKQGIYLWKKIANSVGFLQGTGHAIEVIDPWFLWGIAHAPNPTANAVIAISENKRKPAPRKVV